jgi:hypothetical protein
MRRLHSHEWEHLIQTKDDEIERLREDLELQRKIDLQIIAEKQQLRRELSLAQEGLANYEEEMQARIKLMQQKDEEIQNLQCALNFWLPCIPEACKDEKVIDRVFHDANLLAGYDGPMVDTAEELKWITLNAVPQTGDQTPAGAQQHK